MSDLQNDGYGNYVFDQRNVSIRHETADQRVLIIRLTDDGLTVLDESASIGRLLVAPVSGNSVEITSEPASRPKSIRPL